MVHPYTNHYRAERINSELVWATPTFPADRPMQLLVTALVQCTIITLDSILIKQRRTVMSYTISVNAQQRSALPQIWESITLARHCTSTDLDDTALTKALALTPRYCPVHVMLAHTAAIHETISHGDLAQ
jgi:uncharacterized OsmC-like protein